MVSARLKQVNRLRSSNRRYGRYAFFSGLVLFSGYQALLGNESDSDADATKQPNLRRLLQTEETKSTQTFLQAMESNIGFDKRRRQLGAESSYSTSFIGRLSFNF
jgi:hypothetical protein